MARLFALVVMLGSAVTLWAQGAEQAPPFVASVKPSTADTLVSRPGAFLPGGRFVAQNATLRIIIHRAYPEYTDRPGRIIGPEWIDHERFDVEAKADGERPRRDMLLILRQLLADRFALRVHVDTRQGDGYALVPARADRRLGAGVRPSQAKCPSLPAVESATSRKDLPACALQRGVANGLSTASLRGATMANLATVLQLSAARAVIDRTNLTGAFDIDLEWAAGEALLDATDPDFRPSVFTAVQEQLGLKLEPAQTPVEVLVIDAVGRPKAN
jgi:uncharacterized protein (TIGR03435 family)